MSHFIVVCNEKNADVILNVNEISEISDTFGYTEFRLTNGKTISSSVAYSRVYAHLKAQAKIFYDMGE